MRYWIKNRSLREAQKHAAAAERQQRLLETMTSQVKMDDSVTSWRSKDSVKAYMAKQREMLETQVPSRSDDDVGRMKRKKDRGHRSKHKKEQAIMAKQQQKLLELQLAQLEIDSQPTTESNSTVGGCEFDHGLAFYDYDDYVSVHDFVKDFVKAYNDSICQGCFLGTSLIAAYHATKKKFAKEWKDATKLHMIVSYLSAWGTDHVLSGDYSVACSFAVFANVFEQYAAVLEKNQLAMDLKAAENLSDANHHTLIRFFRKHIPCSCLDVIHEEEKCSAKLLSMNADETLSTCSLEVVNTVREEDLMFKDSDDSCPPKTPDEQLRSGKYAEALAEVCRILVEIKTN